MIRFFKHIFYFPWQDRWLTEDAINQLEAATIAGEKGHGGEIRLVIERKLPLSALRDNLRTRAERHFSSLGLWNTEDRSGVLIYVNLAEHRLELVVDKGIDEVINPAIWQDLCNKTILQIKTQAIVPALVHLIEEVAMLLRQHFGKANDPHGDELPNRPVILG